MSSAARRAPSPGRALRAGLVALAASCLLVPAALAATPNELGLAKDLKKDMQLTYKSKAPGTKFTTVTCKINAAQTGARCVAKFTRASKNVKGSYVVSITADSAGNAQWSAVSASCTKLKTGAKVKCPV